MRQVRSDSATAAVQAAQNAAAGPLEPPAHVPLPDEARPFWDALMRNRPRHRWNDADMATAALLAVSQMQAAALMADVEQLAVVDKLGRRIAMLSRLLHVHPEATQGRAANRGNELATEREAEGNVHPLIRRA
ncbi:TerS protein [Pseudoxanthomonas winnipegensis]|nr:TerS protein [Pseudoxanthomonas winnipegensis]TBV75652.1 TerS protein [Pseudoxanthomonas winnipegensis]